MVTSVLQVESTSAGFNGDICFTGKIYICGGFNGQECLSSAEMYDPEIRQWTLLNPMRNRRSGIGVISYHGCIYALGGFNGITRMNTGERYCPHTRQWTPIPEMYSPRSNFATEVKSASLPGYYSGCTNVLCDLSLEVRGRGFDRKLVVGIPVYFALI